MKPQYPVPIRAGKTVRPTNTQSPVDRAELFLRHQLKVVSAQGLGRLAPIRQLALELGVGYGPMCAAAARLSAASAVTVNRRGGIRIIPESYPPVTPAVSPLGQRIPRELWKDIVNGVLAGGEPLPRVKELALRFGCCAAVVRRSLKQLCEQGAVRRSGHRCIVGDRRRGGGVICMITTADPIGKINVLNQRYIDFMHGVNAEASRREMGIITLSGDHADPVSLAAALQGRTLCGILVWSNGLPQSVISRAILLAGTVTPVALIDEMGDMPLPRSVQRPNVRVFAIAAVSAGETVARYLQLQGHRSIGLVSLQNDTYWSCRREQGIRRACAAAGTRLVCLGGPDEDPKSNLNPETIAIIAQHQKLSHRAAAAGFAFAKMREYRSDLSVMERTESNMVRISRMLTPQVAGSGISAWIGINDETAILVQLQLARLGCDSRVAVVGFDNSANATQYDLSSYDFAFSEIARRMIGFVLHPADPLFSNQKTVECEGFFVERATVLEVSTAREESGGKKAIR